MLQGGCNLSVCDPWVFRPQRRAHQDVFPLATQPRTDVKQDPFLVEQVDCGGGWSARIDGRLENDPRIEHDARVRRPGHSLCRSRARRSVREAFTSASTTSARASSLIPVSAKPFWDCAK